MQSRKGSCSGICIVNKTTIALLTLEDGEYNAPNLPIQHPNKILFFD